MEVSKRLSVLAILGLMVILGGKIFEKVDILIFAALIINMKQKMISCLTMRKTKSSAIEKFFTFPPKRFGVCRIMLIFASDLGEKS